MSLRCKLCDYSDLGNSLYRDGLQTSNPHSRVTIDEKTGDPICSGCAAEINNDLLGLDTWDN